MHSCIIVYGTPIEMTIDQYEPLWAVITPALQQAGVAQALDFSRWRFTDELGNELDRDKTPSTLGLKSNGPPIFLSMEAGIAAQGGRKT